MPIISVLSQSLNQETSVLAPDKKSLSSAQNDPRVLKPNQVIKLLKSSARMKEAKNVFL